MANAYHEVIYAKVVNDKASESVRDSIEVDFKGLNIGRHNTREIIAKHGFTRIAPNTYLAFAPDAEKTAYISIVTEECDSIISKNYPIRENRSVIVNNEGYLREAKYGTIWTER